MHSPICTDISRDSIPYKTLEFTGPKPIGLRRYGWWMIPAFTREHYASFGGLGGAPISRSGDNGGGSFVEWVRPHGEGEQVRIVVLQVLHVLQPLDNKEAVHPLGIRR